MRAACRLAAQLLDHLGAHVKPGVTTAELDELADAWTTRHNATSAPLHYTGGGDVPFPKHICTSINQVVCHGIPSRKATLQEGDIINLDVTPILNGWHGDTSRTFMVGKVSPEAEKLVRVTRECLARGIAEVKPGARLGDIGAAIAEHAHAQGFSVVEAFVGHGIGTRFHMAPQVRHVGRRGTGLRMKPGMVFTIEPMINQGIKDVLVLDDSWTAVTADGKLSAQFEHTVAVTPEGVEVLTAPPDPR